MQACMDMADTAASAASMNGEASKARLCILHNSKWTVFGEQHYLAKPSADSARARLDSCGQPELMQCLTT